MKNQKSTLKSKILHSVETVLLAFFLLLPLSCKPKLASTEGKIKVVVSVAPEYDWLMNVMGITNDKIIPTLIIKNGIDVHSYQPSAKDILDITSADLLVYVGGESDKWITEALVNKSKPNMVVLNLMEMLKEHLKEEEIIEGMEAEQEGDEACAEEDIEYDEHIWFSIPMVKKCVQAISDSLCTLDSEQAELYKANTTSYLEQLSTLDIKYKTSIASSKKDTIIVCDRFPFRYLVDEYNLKYYAAFPGCSAETEASFETVSFLASKVDETDTEKVIILENSKEKLARTVLNASSHKMADILVLDSLQSTSLSQIFNGKTYIKTMESNLETLMKVLN